MESLRSAAACPGIKPQSAIDMLTEAEGIVVYGPGGGAVGLTEDKAVAMYKERTGLDLKSPEDMNKIYSALAESARRDQQAAADREKAKRQAQAKSRGVKSKSGKVPRS